MTRSSFNFKQNHVFIVEEDSSSDKVVIIDEKLDGIDTDFIRNLAVLLRLMFSNEKCGNLEVVLVGGQLGNINRKKKSEVL